LRLEVGAWEVVPSTLLAAFGLASSTLFSPIASDELLLKEVE
jgi:hypothetical protein